MTPVCRAELSAIALPMHLHFCISDPSSACDWMLLHAGAPKVNTLNYTQPNGFLPYGMGGVVKAASSVFFAYVGFDM